MNFLLKAKANYPHRPYPDYPHKNYDDECDLINEMYENHLHLVEITGELNFENIFENFLGSVNSRSKGSDTKRVEVSDERKSRSEEKTENKFERLKKRIAKNCPKKELCVRCSIDKGDCRLLHGWKKEGAVYKHSYPWLGEYLPDSKKVVLYKDNIDDACGEPTYNGVLSTYIHELFHAYFHYVTEQKQAERNYIREIEEAMTEFSTLAFLRVMGKVNRSEWLEILEWAKESIGKKQETVGYLPAYGFGRYLFDNIPENEAFDWINKYAERLGYINEGDEFVKQYKQMVYPCYPADPDKCLELLWKILFETKKGPMKPKGVSSNIVIVNNPWLNISWKKTIADCDKDFFVNQYGSPKDFVNIINKNDSKKDPRKRIEMTFDCLPEPFSGDINSPVYCLNMNPGKPDPDFGGDKYFEEITQLNLDPPKLRGTFWTRHLKNSKGKIHDGVLWLESKTAKLRKDIGVGGALNLFFIDYFPYHSSHGFSFPKDLPSYKYTDFLVKNAMKENKIIIIMRQKKKWFDRIKGLESYPRIITLKCPAGGWLSDNNFNYGSGVNYDDLKNALNKQI